MDIKITIDDRGLKDFSEAMQKELPFALSIGINETAKQAKQAIIDELPKIFILRNQYTIKSIDYNRSDKKQWPNIRSEIGTRSPYLGIQEEGGEKTATNKAFALPKGIRRDEKTQVARSKWPGKILPPDGGTIPMGGRTKGAKGGARSKPKPFLMHEQQGIGVYVRTGKSRKLKRLYRLTRETMHVRGRHWLETPVLTVCNKNLHNNFLKALDEAMRPKA